MVKKKHLLDSLNVYFVFEGEIIPRTTAAVSQVVTETNASLLSSGELDNGH
jgi:hypothetical protein